MKQGLRAALALAVAGALALAASACGGGDESSGTGATTAEKLSGTVTIWDTEYEAIPEYTEAVDKLDRGFEKANPGVTVERVAKPFANWEGIYRAAFTAREGPDVMVFVSGAPGVLSFANGLEPLNDRMSPGLQEELTQWGSATPGFTEEGEHYGIPVARTGYVFYYNKQLFAKAGLPRDFEPQSWSEVREAGEQLKATGIQPFVGGNKEGYENQWWFTVGFQTEASSEEAAQFAAGELPYTDEAIAAAFDPAIEMEEAGLYPDDRFSTELFEGFGDFAEGKGAMILGLWNTAGYWGEFNPTLGEENVGFFFAPGPSAIQVQSGQVWSIPTFAEDKDAAMALIEYEVSEQAFEVWGDSAGIMANRSDAAPPPGFAAQGKELIEASNERENVTPPIIMVPSQVAFGPLSTEISQVLQGRIPIEDAQEAMQEVADKSPN